MGFDQTYDEMLRKEFRPGGGDTAGAAPDPARADAGRAPDVSQASIVRDAPGGVAAAAPELIPVHDAAPSGAVHAVFRASGIHAAEEVPADAGGPKGLSRYRNAAMVGAGGLTCAAIGAFLGGLGGYFTVKPAVAHPLASSAGSNQPLATAVDQAYRVASHGDSTDDGLASFSSPSGSLAHSADPLQWLTTSGSHDLAVSGSPATVPNLPGLGAVRSGSGGLGLGCATESDLGVGCILASVTTVLGTIGSGSSDPTAVVDELLPSLSGVVSDVTGTLSNLGALLPIGSLPTAGLPTTVLGQLGLGSGTGSGLGSLGSLGGSLGSLGSIGAGGGSLPGSTAGAVSSAAAPSGHSGHSGLPVTAPSASVSSAPKGTSTTTTSSSTTTTTKPSGSGSSGTTVTVPLPGLPLPSTPPVSVGGVSVGVNSGSSGSGLSLSLP